MKYGIFNYRESNHYHPRSCLQWFNTYGEAYTKAQCLMKVQDGLHIVVITMDERIC